MNYRSLLFFLGWSACLTGHSAFAQNCLNQFTTLGTASAQSSCFRLTQQAPNNSSQVYQLGAIWSNGTISLAYDFDFTFTVAQCGGADGLAFVLQNSGLQMASGNAAAGGALGYYNQPNNLFQQSVGIEMDLYQNPAPYNDPASPHLMLAINGVPTAAVTSVGGDVTGPVVVANLGDCLSSPRTLRLIWNHNTFVLTALLDGVPRLRYTRNLVSGVFGGNPNVVFGFTGATGDVSATQTVCPGVLLSGAQVKATATGSPRICPKGALTLTATGPDNVATYQWSPATGLSTTTTAAVQAAPLVTTTYTVTATLTNGCALTDTITVQVLPQPTVAITVPSGSRCAGSATTLVARSNMPGATFAWSPSASLNASTGATVTATPTATTTYHVLVTSPDGCQQRDSAQLIITPLPVVFASPTPGGRVQLCAGVAGQLGGAGAVPGVRYRWRPTSGLDTPTAATTAITLTNATAAPWSILYTLVATSATGCVDSSQVRVTVSPLTVADAGADMALCTGQTALLGRPAVAGTTYRWNPSTGLTSATTAQPLFTAANATGAAQTVTYYLTTTQNATGCLARDSVTVTSYPTAVAGAISGPAVVCDVRQPQRYRVAGTIGTTYHWTVTGGSLTAGQGTAQVTVQFASGASAYGVQVIPTIAAYCAGPASSRAVILENASVALTVASVTETDNTRMELNPSLIARLGPAAVRVLRRVAGLGPFAEIGTMPTPGISFTDTGVDAATTSYEYRVEVTNACGETVRSAAVQSLHLKAVGMRGAGGYDQGTTQLRWNAYIGFPVQAYQLYRRLDNGSWQPELSTPDTTLQATIANLAPSGVATGAGFQQDFRVVAVGAGRSPLRANSNTARVEFANLVSTYNIITPNGDGFNDVFVIDNIAHYPGNTLRIYSRWGREVLVAANYQNDWGRDPTLTPGVYYYLLTVPGSPLVKGWVEVRK